MLQYPTRTENILKVGILPLPHSCDGPHCVRWTRARLYGTQQAAQDNSCTTTLSQSMARAYGTVGEANLRELQREAEWLNMR